MEKLSRQDSPTKAQKFEANLCEEIWVLGRKQIPLQMSFAKWSEIVPLSFNVKEKKWVPSLKNYANPGPTLRLATLNVLTDKGEPSTIVAILRPKERYRKILEELQAIDADIVGLNEVTTNFLRFLQG